MKLFRTPYDLWIVMIPCDVPALWEWDWEWKNPLVNPSLTYLICILYIFIFTLNLSFGQPLFGEDRLDILLIESSFFTRQLDRVYEMHLHNNTSTLYWKMYKAWISFCGGKNRLTWPKLKPPYMLDLLFVALFAEKN